MSALRVLVVDDEALARQRLRALLADCVPAPWVQEADSAAAALHWLQRQRFDLLLLDVAMPGCDGLRLAAQVSAQVPAPAVAFVSAHAEYALQAFEVQAQDYLTKPVRLQRLQQLLQKVEQTIQYPCGLDSYFVDEILLLSETASPVALSTLIYLRAEHKYLGVHTTLGTLVLPGSLDALQQRYPQRLLRCHRNTLVALHAVQALQLQERGWGLQLRGLDAWLPVSRRQLETVRAALLSPYCAGPRQCR